LSQCSSSSPSFSMLPSSQTCPRIRTAPPAGMLVPGATDKMRLYAPPASRRESSYRSVCPLNSTAFVSGSRTSVRSKYEEASARLSIRPPLLDRTSSLTPFKRVFKV
jgi:hypothetical protein